MNRTPKKKNKSAVPQPLFQAKPAAGGSEIGQWLGDLSRLFRAVSKSKDPEHASLFLGGLILRFRESGVKVRDVIYTPYANTIPVKKEVPYPGNRELEHIKESQLALVNTKKSKAAKKTK